MTDTVANATKMLLATKNLAFVFGNHFHFDIDNHYFFESHQMVISIFFIPSPRHGGVVGISHWI